MPGSRPVRHPGFTDRPRSVRQINRITSTPKYAGDGAGSVRAAGCPATIEKRHRRERSVHWDRVPLDLTCCIRRPAHRQPAPAGTAPANAQARLCPGAVRHRAAADSAGSRGARGVLLAAVDRQDWGTGGAMTMRLNDTSPRPGWRSQVVDRALFQPIRAGDTPQTSLMRDAR